MTINPMITEVRISSEFDWYGLDHLSVVINEFDMKKDPIPAKPILVNFIPSLKIFFNNPFF